MQRSLRALLKVQPFLHSLAVGQSGCRLVHASSALQEPAKAVAKVVSAKSPVAPKIATKPSSKVPTKPSSKVPTKAPKGKVQAAKKAPIKIRAATKVKAPAPKKPVKKPVKQPLSKGLPTALGLFVKERHQAVKAANPDKKAVEVFKVIMSQYRALSTNEKQAYFDKARDIREPLLRERRKVLVANKKPPNAYALFFQDNFSKIKGQSETTTIPEVGKKVAELWKKISVTEKKLYTDRSHALNKQK